MDIWDGTKWVEIDDKINDEGIFSVEVSSPTKSVLFSPNGDVFAAFLQRYDNLRVVVKRYNPSNRVWVKEYESEPYLEANSPSLAQYDGYIYVAEGGKREEVVCVGSVCFPYRVSKIHIKRALLPFGRAQFEECFARVVSSKNGIEELMNRDCLVENMVFYNGFLYDVLKDPSRTLRERVFAGAYLFEFPQYLNEERISYLNSSEFVSLLREALFQYDGDYIQEKAMFSLVREENEYAGILISDILSSIEHPEFETMMRRHIAGESFIFIGNLLFNLLFEDSYSGGKVYGLFPFLGTSGIPFYRFIQLFYSSAPREKKLRGLRCLIDIFTHRKVDEIEEGTRNALIEAICEMSVDPLLRGESFLAISFLKGKCEGKDAIDLLGEGEYLPEILRGISEAGDVADISRLQEIATAEDMPLYTRLWAFWSLSDIALRNELGDVIIWVLENGYLFAREILLNENIPSFLRLEAFSFVSGITDPWGLSELAKEVIYSTQNLSFLSEVLPSIAQNTDCSLIPDAEFLHSAYSYELTQVASAYDALSDFINKKIVEIEEKRNEILVKIEGGVKKNRKMETGIMKKLDEAIAYLPPDEEMRESVLRIKRTLNEVKDLLVGINIKMDINITEILYKIGELIGSAKEEIKRDIEICNKKGYKKAGEKLKEAFEKLKEAEEKIGEIWEKINEIEEKENEVCGGITPLCRCYLKEKVEEYKSTVSSLEYTKEIMNKKCANGNKWIYEKLGIPQELDPPEEGMENFNPYTIYGYLKDEDGEPLKGVTVEFGTIKWVLTLEQCKLGWPIILFLLTRKFLICLFPLGLYSSEAGMTWTYRLTFVALATATTDDQGAFKVSLDEGNYFYRVINPNTYNYIRVNSLHYVHLTNNVVIVVPYATSPDKDADGLSDYAEDHLIYVHRPRFWLGYLQTSCDGKCELWHPTSPRDFWIEISDQLRERVRWWFDNEVVSNPYYCADTSCKTEENWNEALSIFYTFATTRNADNYFIRSQNPRSGPTPDHEEPFRVSSHVLPIGGEEYKIAYWVFFDKDDDHDGDWEHINVFVKGGYIQKVAFYHHGYCSILQENPETDCAASNCPKGGECYPISELQYYNSSPQQLEGYIEFCKHGIYWRVGEGSDVLPHCADNACACKTAKEVPLVPIYDRLPEGNIDRYVDSPAMNTLYSFKGFWGDTCKWFCHTESPKGPATREDYNAPDH